MVVSWTLESSLYDIMKTKDTFAPLSSWDESQAHLSLSYTEFKNESVDCFLWFHTNWYPLIYNFSLLKQIHMQKLLNFFFFGNDIRSWTFISEIKDMLCCMCKKGIKAVCNLIGGGINGDVHVCYTWRFLPVITEGSHDLQVYMYTWGCLESSWGGLEVLRKQS